VVASSRLEISVELWLPLLEFVEPPPPPQEESKKTKKYKNEFLTKFEMFIGNFTI
jgi:hypothetical protein